MSASYQCRIIEEETSQQIFTRVARHLLEQGEQSLSFDRCAYRGEEGRSCAVGCLISDEEYDQGMEGRSVEYVFDISEGAKADLLEGLQCIHDVSSPEKWRSRLEKLASDYNLKWEL